MSASPARIGAAISATSPGSYWLSAWTITITVGAVAQRAHVAGLLPSRRSRGWPGGAARRGRARARPRSSRRRATSSISSARSAACDGHLLDDVGDRARRAVGGQDDVHRAPRRRGARSSGSAGRCTSVRWARMTRSSPSDRLSGHRAAGARAAASSGAPAGPRRSARPVDPAPRRERAHERDVGRDDEAGGGDQLAQRPARQQARVRGHDSPTSAARPRLAVADDGSGVTTHSTPPGRRSAAQRAIAVDRVVEVLEHVGEHDDVEARRVAVRRRSPRARARARRGRARRARATADACDSSRPTGRSRAGAPRRAAARGRSRRRAAGRPGRSGRSGRAAARPVARRPASSPR